MSRRPKRLAPTFADYLAIAVGPVLVGLLVGSLVFFLIEVFYEGPFESRLQFIMAMFVVAAVGIARISIEEGREYAALFALPLGVLIAIAAWRLVEFRGPLAAVSPLLSIGLVAIIWWSTDRLIWDCTVLEEREGEEGVGLLQTAGLDAGGDSPPATPVAPERTEGVTAHEPPSRSFWEWFVDMRRRPHAPGVWVLLYSLAALPIFGLGQKLLPAGDEASRRFVFLLLVVYVASGLALLLLTSFLSLRQYLRQRRLPMPATMAAAWVFSGTALIAVVLGACLLLPQRTPAYAMVGLPWHGETPDDRNPSTWAVGQDGREDDRGDRTVSRDDADRTRPAGSDDEGPPSADAQASAEPDTQGSARTAESRPRMQQQADSTERADASEASADTAQGDRRPRTGDQPEARSLDRQAAGPTEDAGTEAAAQAAVKPTPAAPPPSSSWPRTTGLPAWLPAAAAVACVLVAAILGWVFREPLLAILASLRERLADLWRRLFAGRSDRGPSTTTLAMPPRRRTFADFTDPFASGSADGRDVDELIRYSFLAFEAWCGDRGHVRPPHQTVHEFTHSVASRREDVARDVRHLAELVSCSAYGRQAVSRSQIEPLRRLWQRMRG
jgi:hypothetical protein